MTKLKLAALASALALSIGFAAPASAMSHKRHHGMMMGHHKHHMMNYGMMMGHHKHHMMNHGMMMRHMKMHHGMMKHRMM